MITLTLANRLLDSFLRPGPVFVSLHTSEPGEDGAFEVFGEGYARQPASFEAAADRTSLNAGRLEFRDMPDATVAFVGLWDAPRGGTFLWASDRQDPPYGIPREGILRLDAGNLAVKMLIR